MKKILSMAFAGLIAFSTNAQDRGNWCGSDAHLQELLDADPAQRAYFEQKLEEQIARSASVQRNGETVIVPTVVHVLYADCDASISAAQVKDGIRVLNEDMMRLNGDTSETRAIFKPHAAATPIEFRLAQIDPDGNPTNGITRTLTNAALSAGQNVKSIINWPANEYFNIWVVENIAGGGGGTILGYAQFPGSGSWGTYGIVIRDDMFGTIGTATADGRTLTHEIGHCLNLFHTFQSGCGGNCNTSGDRICDTPPVVTSSWACDFGMNTCANDASGSNAFNSNVVDQIENYMSYNDCQNMFTNDQADRMLAVFNTHTVLNELVSEENLINTGVGGFLAADFDPELDVVVADRPSTFIDLTRYEAEEWSWDFGASSFPPTSTDQNPSVAMIETGIRSITLDVSRGGEDLSVTKNVLVCSQEGQSIPFSEDFESAGSFPTLSWITKNNDADEHGFVVTNLAAYSGEQSIMIENEGKCEAYTDELISQTMDFSPFSEVELTFKAAFARRDINSTDFMRVYVSRDYGESWQLAGLKGSTSLESVSGFKNGSWVPASQDEWKEHSFAIFQSNLMREGILVKIEFTAEGGNNLFIDDIAFNGDFTGELLLKSPKDETYGLKKDVLLDWKAVGAAQSYEYQLDQVTSFDSEALITGTTTFINSSADNEDTEAFVEDLELNTVYFWRVRYQRNNGDWSDWSETWAFQVSADGLSTGDDPVASDWKAYPNPADDRITIASNAASLQNVSVYDISGRMVQQVDNIHANTFNLDVQGLDAGMYFLQLTDDKGPQKAIPVMVR